MSKKKNYDPYESKHRFCDPGACHCCEDRGGGNFFCRLHNVLVVRNWHNTERERICKRSADNRPAKPARDNSNQKRRADDGK